MSQRAPAVTPSAPARACALRARNGR
jgi:hypothetical protein